jgi:hypothetical protein
VNSEWAEFTYQEPSISKTLDLNDVNELRPEMEQMGWRASHMVIEGSPQSSIATATIASEVAELFVIVHDSLSLLYGRAKNTISAVNVLNQYGRYEEWRNRLPQELQSVDEANQLSAHVLFIQ